MECSNLSGTASGRLLLNLAENQAEFYLNSSEFFLCTILEFSQKNQLQKHITSDSEVRINGRAVQMDKLAMRGGIFGSEGQNAGVVFGFRNSNTHVIGIATGQRKQLAVSGLFPGRHNNNNRIGKMERATGFEPATSSLGSLRSTN